MTRFGEPENMRNAHSRALGSALLHIVKD